MSRISPSVMSVTAVIAAVVCIMVVVVQQRTISNLLSAVDWHATVQMVGQPGSTEQNVIHWMGKPDIEMSLERATNLLSGAYTPRIPVGTKKVLYYEYGFWSPWMAYFFIGNNGKVLGYQTRAT